MKKREEEINKCILEYLIIKKYNNSVEPFMKDTGLKNSDATTGNKLEKKMGYPPFSSKKNIRFRK